MTKQSKLSHKLATFEGVFCSGFFIPDQSTVTALALLFDKVHFLNQLEYVIELSKRYRIEHPASEKIENIQLKPRDEEQEDPLAALDAHQKHTVHTYLFLSDQFFLHNALLFPKVFRCSLLPEGEVLSCRLLKKGKKGELNTYEVKRNPLTVSTGREGELNRLLAVGCVPVVGGIVPSWTPPSPGGFSPTQIASALAIKSVALVLPGTRAAKGADILEARDRLRDHLPPFWASMLKLSAEFSQGLNATSNEGDLQREVDDAVSTIVRPALIELVSKLEKERKLFFYRILSPLTKGLRVLAGKPPTDLAGFLASSLTVGADVSLDIARQLRSVEALKQGSGLTYLIELHKTLE